MVACLLLSRIVTGVAAAVLSTRRGRDVVGAVGLRRCSGLAPLVSWMGDRGFNRSTLDDLAAVVAWTPLGWPWAPAGDAPSASGPLPWPTGARGPALPRTLLVWERLLVSVLRNPRTSSGDGGQGSGPASGCSPGFPATPMGAVAARAGTYWIRDPRFNFPA